MTHTVTITDVDNPKYPVLVSCTCNYQCHCRNEEEALFRKRHHESAAMMNEATKGYAHGHL
jgi:hypothetical protein